MADGTLKVGTITTSSGSGTITLGQSGETVDIPSGATVSGAGAMTPAFEAYLSSDQSISDDTWTKVNIDSEVYDTNPSFASNKFTPGVAGKYFIYASVLIETTGGHEYNLGQTGLYKNGSEILDGFVKIRGVSANNNPSITTSSILVLSAGDYIELYFYTDNSDTNVQIGGGANTFMSGYKLIGI